MLKLLAVAEESSTQLFLSPETSCSFWTQHFGNSHCLPATSVPPCACPPQGRSWCLSISWCGTAAFGLMRHSLHEADVPGAAVQKLSRKLVHISSGPLFVLTWPLFRFDAPSAFLPPMQLHWSMDASQVAMPRSALSVKSEATLTPWPGDGVLELGGDVALCLGH